MMIDEAVSSHRKEKIIKQQQFLFKVNSCQAPKTHEGQRFLIVWPIVEPRSQGSAMTHPNHIAVSYIA